MLAHTLSRYSVGGLQGTQCSQRDWSPFVAHFTSYGAMAQIREIVDTKQAHRPVKDAKWVTRELSKADKASFEILKLIKARNNVLSSHPAGDIKTPKCVCLSECNLPSLITHAEKYGRFGLIFKKNEIFAQGARPCAYLSDDYRKMIYKCFKEAERSAAPNVAKWSELLALCQMYKPFIGRGRVQDFAHEREWRLFQDLDISTTKPSAVLAPKEYIQEVKALLPDVHQVMSLDDLFEWGA